MPTMPAMTFDDDTGRPRRARSNDSAGETIAPRRMPDEDLGHPMRQPQRHSLTTQAHVWLARLRPDRQPMAAARRHPHVVNRLAELWADHDARLVYLRELMLGTRPTERQGFTFEVLAELADLQALAEEEVQRRT